MKYIKLFLLLVFVLLIATGCSVREFDGGPRVESVLEYTYNLPYVPLHPSSGDCVGSSTRGVGWLAGPIKLDQETWCFWYWYNISRNNNPRVSSGQIPIFWCDSSGNLAQARELNQNGYSGYVIVLNEPDRPEQCNRSPERAAEILLQYKDILGDAKIISPNVIVNENAGLPYLTRFLDEVERLTNRPALDTIYRIGIHFYGGFSSPSERMDAVCDLLTSRYGYCLVWLTEYGAGFSKDGRSDFDIYKQWVTEVEADSRIEIPFGYTIRGSQYNVHNWEINGAGVTDFGRAWLSVVRQ